MHSLSPAYLNVLRFSDSQLSTLKKIGEYRGKHELYIKQTPETLASLRQLSMIESSESSNRIEGIVAPHHRIEAIVLKETTPKNHSEQEIAGYRDALALIHESAKHMKLSTNLILQLHNMLYQYSPYKTEQIISAINKKIGTFSISDIEKACPGTSRDMVRMVLRQLRDQGKIRVVGKGRGAKWFK